MTPISAHLARLTREIAVAPLPPQMIADARLCLLDYLAAVLAAPAEPLAGTIAPVFGPGRARLLHDARPLSEAGAAYLHGFLATVEDIDDSHALASGMHLSATVLPVALALAESRGASEADLLRAILAGYEIGGRLARSMDGGLRACGFHATGAVGPFAACATAAVLTGLDAAALNHAFGIAASGAGGLFAFLPTGAGVRHSHAANACVAGLAAVAAAAGGVTGPPQVFEGPDGVVQALASGTMDRDLVLAPSPAESGRFEISNAYHKRFNACGHALPGITLALELRPALLPQLDRIEAIVIDGYRASAALAPLRADTVAAAKFSLPVIVALAIHYGDVSAREMRPEAIATPEVLALARKVIVVEDTALSAGFPRRRSGRMAVRLKGGGSIERATDTPIGMPGNALGMPDVTAKFHAIAPERIGTARAEALLRAVAGLDDRPDRFQLP